MRTYSGKGVSQFVNGQFKALFALLVLFTTIHAFAASYCVGPLATGNGSGADWANLKAWSSAPVRGDIWYLRDGTYASKTLNTAASGTNLIIIRKATASNHLTETGWVTSYANQASIGGLTIGSSYWLIDGVTGGGAGVVPCDRTPSNYGIYITPTDNAVLLQNAITDITFSHCYFYTTIDGGTGIYQADVSGQNKTNIVVSYCLADGWNEFLRNGSSIWYSPVMEYTVVLHSQGSDAQHGNPINIMWAPMYGLIVRYSVFYDYNHTYGNHISGIIGGNGANAYDSQIYGNVFDSLGSTVFLFGGNAGLGGSFNGTFHHNTIINSPDYSGYSIIGVNVGSGNLAYNNLIYQVPCNFPFGSPVSDHDYNAWISCTGAGATGAGEAHTQVGSGNPFVDLANLDYRLKTNTVAGKTLANTYQVDALGNPRTSWSRGAFEFKSGGVATNAAISVSAGATDFGVIAVGASTNLTFTVRNIGGSTLSGTASVAAPFAIVSGGTYSLGSNQSQVVTVRYSPTAAGNHSASLTFTGGGGSVIGLSGVAYSVLSGLTFSADAGILSAPFVSSGGTVSQSVDTGVTDGGRAVYTFTITNAGDYQVQAIVNAPSAAENSLFVNIDAEPTDPQMIWHIPVTAGLQTAAVSWQGAGTYDAPQFVPKVFTLASGNHQLYIRGREANVKLQRIAIVKMLLSPSGLHVVSSP